MKNSIILLGIIVIVLAVGTFIYFNSGSAHGTNGDTILTTSEAQKITISEKNANYYPNNIEVNVNQPVEISLDNSVKGCLRSFTVRDLNVQKYLATPNDKLTFTPTKKGTYAFACSMGMGYGKLIIK